jgi:hypothetical protein
MIKASLLRATAAPKATVWADVSAYGRHPELQDRRKDLHTAIGQQVLDLVWDGRTPYKTDYSTHTVAFCVNSKDANFWIEKFVEAIDTDQVRELAQELFSMSRKDDAA